MNIKEIQWGRYRPRPAVALCAAALVLYVAGSMMGQLQQSGGPGSSVTVSNASLPVTQSGSWNVGQTGTWTVQPGNTANTTPWLATLSQGGNSASVTASNALKVDGSAVTQPISGTVTVNALPVGSNVIGTVDTIPKTACGNTVASQPLAAVPTVSTAVFSSTTCVQAIIINNTNSSSATITISDNQSTPINDVLTFSIPANSQLIQPLWGIAMTSGIKWAASTTGVTGAVLGFQ
jgi:hypothetical protein